MRIALRPRYMGIAGRPAGIVVPRGGQRHAGDQQGPGGEDRPQAQGLLECPQGVHRCTSSPLSVPPFWDALPSFGYMPQSQYAQTSREAPLFAACLVFPQLDIPTFDNVQRATLRG